MGVLVLLHWMLTYGANETLDGIIVAGALLALKKELSPPRVVLALLKVFAMIFPLVRVPDKGLDETFDGAFGDPAVPVAARKDPLVMSDKTPTIRFMCQGLATMQKVEKRLGSINVPLLVMHGLEDIRCDWEVSQKIYDEAASEDKTLKLYRGMKHQLLQDLPENTRIVIDEIVGWVKARSEAQPANKS